MKYMGRDIIEKYIRSIIMPVKNKGVDNKDLKLLQEYFDFIFSVSEIKYAFIVVDDTENIITGYNLGDNLTHSLKGHSFKINTECNYENKDGVQFTERFHQYDIYTYIYGNKEFFKFNKQYYLYVFTLDNIEIPKVIDKLFNKVEKLESLLYQFGNNQNQDFLLNCLDSVDDAISISNKEGILVYANEKCGKILGVKAKDLIGKKADCFTENKPLLYEIMEGQKKIIDFQHIIECNNKSIYLMNSGYPVININNEIIGAINIFNNIKRSRKLTNKMAGNEATFNFDDIIGDSNKNKEIIKNAKVFSGYDANVLIQGESGTGKELFAQSIHNYSDRRNGPFVAINCANFPTELIDSELFGYESGAFTGANKGGKIGKFELANGGTLFLDEIGEMDLNLESKLLRVLETRKVMRLGGNNVINIDTRIIAATNRDLNKMVKEKKFREDLYYRLKVLTLKLIPLRERKEDIPLFVNYFVKKTSDKSNKNIVGIDGKAMEMIVNYPWPGNVRELQNTISRAVYISDTEYITEKCLMLEEVEEKDDHIINKNDVKIDKEHVMEALTKNGGNKKKTAELLGISRPTLYKLLKD